MSLWKTRRPSVHAIDLWTYTAQLSHTVDKKVWRKNKNKAWKTFEVEKCQFNFVICETRSARKDIVHSFSINYLLRSRENPGNCCTRPKWGQRSYLEIPYKSYSFSVSDYVFLCEKNLWRDTRLDFCIMGDYYAMLEVPKTASSADIKKA